MSENTQKPHNHSIESMVGKIFRYQQRQKYWQIAKFTFLTLLIATFGLGLLRQVNRSLMGVTNTTKPISGAADKKHLSLIDLRGPIWGSFDTSTASTSDIIIPALRRAFKDPKTVAVVLCINSPGGTPVQSNQIYNEIHYLRQKYPNTPIYAVCEEVCASAAYHIASACDGIYADPSSLIGAIGVVHSGFGYEEALKKLGIERRLITAGDSKGMLDPYSPLKAQDVRMLKEMHAELHRMFIAHVKRGRGDRLVDLNKNESELFSGRVWIGTQALALGLVDELGNVDTIARNLKVGMVSYTPQADWRLQLRKLAGLNLSTKMMQEGLSSGLLEPLMGSLQPFGGLKDPIVGMI